MTTLRLRRGLGWVLNTLSVPGFMRAAPCEHRLGIPVEITVTGLFTVVHVRDVKVFFDRLTGRFDGVSVEPVDCESRGSRSTS